MDDTVIIFTTDHGFYLGEHGLIGKSIITDGKFAWAPLYNEVAAIPFIMYVPGEGHKEIEELIQLPDIAPTILELAGIEPPPTVNGKSLVPLIRGEVEHVREFAVHSPPINRGPSAGMKTSIITKEWSLLIPGDQKPVEPYEYEFSVDGMLKKVIKKIDLNPELYNLVDDPKQEKNIISDYPDVARELHEKYIQFLRKIGTPEEIVKPWLKLNI